MSSEELRISRKELSASDNTLLNLHISSDHAQPYPIIALNCANYKIGVKEPIFLLQAEKGNIKGDFRRVNLISLHVIYQCSYITI